MAFTLYNPSQEAVIHKFVASLQQEIATLLATQPQVTIGLPGGATYQSVWAALKEVDGIDWSRIHLFMADERLVPIGDAQSNFKQAYDGFIKELIIDGRLPETNAHPFIYDPIADKDESVYERELGRYGGRLDIILLGMGNDGHTAALFPHHIALDAGAAGFTVLHNAPKPPADRVTCTPNMIKQAPVVFMVVMGAAKRPAYTLLTDAAKTWHEVPARLAMEAAKCYVVTDLKT
jgi:6-phosphogluconolactonase